MGGPGRGHHSAKSLFQGARGELAGWLQAPAGGTRFGPARGCHGDRHCAGPARSGIMPSWASGRPPGPLLRRFSALMVSRAEAQARHCAGLRFASMLGSARCCAGPSSPVCGASERLLIIRPAEARHCAGLRFASMLGRMPAAVQGPDRQWAGPQHARCRAAVRKLGPGSGGQPVPMTQLPDQPAARRPNARRHRPPAARYTWRNAQCNGEH